MNRRTALEVLSVGLLQLAAGCSKTKKDPSQSSFPASSPSPTIPVRSQYTLQQLIEEADDPTIKYKGFPTLVQEAGFKFAPVLYKTDPRRQVVIIGESHGISTPKIIELITLLISRYGFDSLGLEGSYGYFSPENLERQKKERLATIGDTRIKPYEFTIETRSGPKKINLDRADLAHQWSPEYEMLGMKNMVPTYGLEHRDTHLTTLIFQAYRGAINMAGDVARLIQSQGAAEFTLPAPFFRDLEKYMKQLRERQPGISLPATCLYEAVLIPHMAGESITDPTVYVEQHHSYHKKVGLPCPRGIKSFKTLEEFAQGRILYEQELNAFYKAWRVFTFRSRTRKMAENIQKCMEELDSKKGIIVAGATHVFRQIDYPGKTATYEYTLPHLLPYTSLAINATGIDARL